MLCLSTVFLADGNILVRKKKNYSKNLPQLKGYLEKQDLGRFIDLPTFSKALSKGLFFDSNIPLGYGMGSSGALCAAIYDTFGKNKEQYSLQELKGILGRMESFFHGASSGIDPLVCYLDHPIIINPEIKKVDLPKANITGKGSIFLIDTGVKREASPFIHGFLERCKEEIYNKKCKSQLVPLVDDAIHTYLNGQWAMLFNTLHELSLFQYRYFDFMILDTFKEVWLKGLSSNHFKLKICGAGGGGFLLGISIDYKKTEKELKKYITKVI